MAHLNVRAKVHFLVHPEMHIRRCARVELHLFVHLSMHKSATTNPPGFFIRNYLERQLLPEKHEKPAKPSISVLLSINGCNLSSGFATSLFDLSISFGQLL